MTSGGYDWADFLDDDDEIASAFDRAEAAAEDDIIPRGSYTATIDADAIEQHTSSKKGTKAVQIVFTIVDDGPAKGRKIWHQIWLTPKNVSRAKRDLAKLGVDKFSDLDSLSGVIFTATIKVVHRKDDNGEPRHEIRKFVVSGAEEKPDVVDAEFPPADIEIVSADEPAEGDRGDAWEGDDEASAEEAMV